MRTLFAAAIVWCLFFWVTPVAAEYDNFRCGAELISVGDTTGKVFMRCGEPSWKEFVGFTDGRLENQLWYYNCGTNDYLYVLRFVGGRLKEIASEGYGSGRSDCYGSRRD